MVRTVLNELPLVGGGMELTQPPAGGLPIQHNSTCAAADAARFHLYGCMEAALEASACPNGWIRHVWMDIRLPYVLRSSRWMDPTRVDGHSDSIRIAIHRRG